MYIPTAPPAVFPTRGGITPITGSMWFSALQQRRCFHLMGQTQHFHLDISSSYLRAHAWGIAGSGPACRGGSEYLIRCRACFQFRVHLKWPAVSVRRRYVGSSAISARDVVRPIHVLSRISIRMHSAMRKRLLFVCREIERYQFSHKETVDRVRTKAPCLPGYAIG